MSDNDNGFLGAALTATPLGIGVGVGVRNIINTTSFSSRESAIEQMRKVAEDVKLSEVNLQTHIDFMNTQFQGGKNAQAAIAAWEEAISRVDPITRRQLKDFTGSIKTMSDQDAISAIIRTMQQNKSLLMRNVYSKFIRNAEALSVHQKIFPHIPINLKSIAVSEIPYVGTVLPSNLSEPLQRIASTLGATTTPKMPYRSRGDFGVFKISLAGMQGGDISFNLPITHQGMMVEGMTMQTQRIAPQIALVEGGKMSTPITREEFFLREFEKSIVPDIKSGRLSTRAEIQSAVSELHDKMFTELESATYLDDTTKMASQKIREETRSNLVQLIKEQERITEGKIGYVPSYTPLTGKEYSEALVANQLYGGVSPTAVSKGIASQEDISKYFLFPEAKNWGRRPESSFREYQLTEQAISNLEELQGHSYAKYQQMQSKAYRDLLTKTREGKAVSPILTTTYIDPQKHAELLRDLNIREGHIGMTHEARHALEFETTRTMKLKTIREDLSALLDQDEFTVKKGEILGTNLSGDIITAEQEMTMRLMRNKNKAEGEVATAIIKDMWSVEHGDKFHGDHKATVLAMSQKHMKRILKTVSNNQRFVDNTQVYASMDNLVKDRQLYRQQIVTSLGIEMDTKRIKQLMTYSSKLSKKVGLDDVEFTRGMMRYALDDIGVSPGTFGAAFGASSYVLDNDVAEGVIDDVLARSLRPEKSFFKQAAMHGLAIGGTRLAFDSPPALKGAGVALGSLESRIFEIFRDPHWGQLGSDLSDEIVQRMITTNPDKYEVHKAVGKTLESIVSQTSMPLGATAFDAPNYTSEGFQQWMENLGTEGGWIKQGKGLRDVYVPSPSVVTKMRPYPTAAGTETPGDLAKIYHNIARNASRMHLQIGSIGPDEAMKNLQQYTSELAYQWAPAGKGMGGYQRGGIAGSRYLRAVAKNKTHTTMKNLRTAGITQSAFDSMMRELVEQQGDNAALKEMRERFAQDGRVGGLIARHPTFGSFSMQQMFFKKISGNRSQIVLPETVLTNLTLEGEDTIKSLTLGPAIGLSLDYDADQVAAFLVSPDNEKAIFNNLSKSNNDFTNAYNQHQIRYQILKAKKAQEAGGMTIAEKMAADIRKIGTTQTWVPKLSTEMTRARAALGKFGQGQAAEDAKMLLEWLEQTPISAKHQTAQDVAEGGIEDMMNRIQYSLRNRTEGGIQSIVKDIVKHNPQAGKLLTGDITLTKESATRLSETLGMNVSQTIRGVNVAEAEKELMRSMTAASTTGSDDQARILMGRAGKVKFDKLAAVLQSTKTGGFSTVSKAVTAATNVAASLGAGVIRNKKPLAWGFAGSLAIASMLSSPKDTIGPGNGLNVGLKPNMSLGKGADRMSPENVMPPSQAVGQPSVPNSLHQQSVILGSNTTSHRAHVRANVGSGVNAAEISKRIANMTNRSTSINIRDDRQSLNPHRIANKLL